MEMNFDTFIETCKTEYTEDGFTIFYDSIYWKEYLYYHNTWKTNIKPKPIEFPFVHEIKDHIVDGIFAHKYVEENKSIPIPTEGQKNTLEFYLSNEVEIFELLISRIEEEYENQIQFDSSLQVLTNRDELKETIELHRIYILPNSNHKNHIIGFYFGCKWDDEHGYGILIDNMNIIKTGGIEEATDLYYSPKENTT